MHCACWPLVGSTREQIEKVGLIGVPLCSKLGGTPGRPCCGSSRQGVELSESCCVSAMPLYNAGSNMSTLLTKPVVGCLSRHGAQPAWVPARDPSQYVQCSRHVCSA